VQISVPMQRRRMGSATSKSGSSKTHQLTKRMKNQSDRSELDSNLNSGYHNPFLPYWIYDLSGPTRDPTHLAQVFVDTGANCNTISRALFQQQIDRGLVSKFVKRLESGVRISLMGGKPW